MRIIILTAAIAAMVMTTVNGKTNSGGEQAQDGACTLPDRFIIPDLSPELDPEVFSARRKRLAEKMKGEIAIISAAAGNDFIYLTGYTGERQAVAVIDPSSEAPYTLFVLPREPMSTLWDGPRPGIEDATEKYGADAAYPVAKFAEIMAGMIEGKRPVSLHEDDRSLRERLNGIAGKDVSAAGLLHTDLTPIIHEMRVVKDEWEIAQLKRAVAVTGLAHRRVMETVAPGQKEYDAQAEIEYVFMKNGLNTGFSSIVGSGPNAAILHYPFNDRTMEYGDLLLIDIGASCRGYVADVTRTIPVNGRFSEKQRDLYELVLQAQQEAINKMKPGYRILDCHHRATEIIVRGLWERGLITDTTSWWQKRFYIQYRNNHYIGLHVHDAGSYGNLDAPDRDSYILNPEIRGREILPGMVMTIEPGLYLLEDRLDHLHGLFG
ncbi:MAG: M24 family metallopeptidase, partial [Marinilabiliales bacterium]